MTSLLEFVSIYKCIIIRLNYQFINACQNLFTDGSKQYCWKQHSKKCLGKFIWTNKNTLRAKKKKKTEHKFHQHTHKNPLFWNCLIVTNFTFISMFETLFAS